MAGAKQDNVSPAERIPKEHAPLDYLLSQIPKKAQKGMLIQCDLQLHSIDANEHFIALGSNVGVVFLYNRKQKELERLRTHSHSDVITSVAIHSGLEHQVAVGTHKGEVYLFQMPSLMPSQSKQLQQFIVSGVHKSEITCLCWSLNGMKLFSGDKKGLVAHTEVDFYTGACETNISLIENDSEIVQLNHAHKALVISTNKRSILFRTDTKAALVQIGQKDRKIFGKFGATFLPGLCKPEDAELYASRPGLRIWKAKMDGTVSSTFLFKELINDSCPTIELLPFKKKSKMFLPESQFGPVYLYKDKYIVTWSDTSLFILNPENTSVFAGTFHVGTIQKIAVTKDEIFLLRKETDRNVIRIAERPESLGGNTYHRLVKDTDMPDFVTETHRDESAQSSSPLKFIKENVIEKIKNMDTLSEITNSVSGLVDKNSELRELPPIVKLDTNNLKSIEIFQSETSKEEGDKNVISPIKRERFNPFLKEDSHHTEDELDTSDLSMCNTKKYDTNTQPSQQTTHQREEDHHASPNEGKTLDRIKKVPIVHTDDDIAISVKTKKKKKKKTDHKSSTSSKHADSDTMSQNSVEGVPELDHRLHEDKPEPMEKLDVKASDFKSSTTSIDISDIVGLKPIDPIKNDDKCDKKEEKDLKTIEENKLEPTKNEIGQINSNQQSEVNKDCDLVKGEKITELPDAGKSESIVPDENLSDAQVGVTKISEKITSDGIVSQNEPRPKFSLTDSQSVVTKVEKREDIVSSAIASKITRPKKKESTLSKLEKNLASLEKGLDSDFYSANTSYLKTTTNPEEKQLSNNGSLLDKSQADSGNGYMLVDGDKSLNETIISKEKLKGNSIPSSSSPDSNSPRSPIPNNKTIYRRESLSCDDFYSKYSSPSVVSPTNEIVPSQTNEHPLVQNELEESHENQDEKTESVRICEAEDLNTTGPKTFNTWVEVVTSGNLQSLTMSDTHIWCADKSTNIWYGSLKSSGIKWIKANGYAKQIAVSRSGMIIWRLYKDTVFAGTKITPKHPEGMKWVEALREVHAIAVDNTSAWYIKLNGDVAVQKGLSKDRPCYKSTFIECPYKLQHIACKSGVVWAITDQCKLVYRAGIKQTCPEGKVWAEYISPNPEGIMFACVSFGDGDVAWGIDIVGRVYFMTNVSMETPLGDNIWWQVPMDSEITTFDSGLLESIKSLTKMFDPQKLADLLSTQKGGLVAAGTEGVCVCPEYKNILQMCKGSIEGHLWKEIHLSGIVSSTAWKLISVSTLHVEHGLIWTQQASGDLFTFHPSKKNVGTIEKPAKGQFTCLSVCEEAVWGLNDAGKVFIRSGIASHCPQGAKWCDLDLKQLGDSQIIHLCCGTRNVWAVDDEGIVYQRIGVKAPTSHSLQAAWLPIDTLSTGTTFIQIYTGPSDQLVWAVDNRRQTYVRMGVTDEMPIGTSWVHIPGTQVMQLAISKYFVWALELNGEILCRHGITQENPGGLYWKRIPGIFIHISCSVDDQLWAIGSEGRIYCRKTRYLLRKDSQENIVKRRVSSGLSTSEDWELL